MLIFSEWNNNNAYGLIEYLYETLFKSQNYVENMKVYLLATHSLSGYYITLYHTLPTDQLISSTTLPVNQTSQSILSNLLQLHQQQSILIQTKQA